VTRKRASRGFAFAGNAQRVGGLFVPDFLNVAWRGSARDEANDGASGGVNGGASDLAEANAEENVESGASENRDDANASAGFGVHGRKCLVFSTDRRPNPGANAVLPG